VIAPVAYNEAMRRTLLVLAVLGCLAVPGKSQAQSPTRGLHADRFDARLTLLADGSLEVEEVITLRFTDRAFREVERRVPIGRVDDLIDVEALMDGRVLPAGREAGQASIGIGRRELRVLWRFPETRNTTHQFTLRYRAMGALRVDTRGAHLAWHILPTRHRYAISDAELIWQVPAGVVSQGGPALEAEGWSWTREGEQVWSARKRDVAVHETAILTDHLEPTSLAIAPSRWQVDEDRARQLAPAFIVGGAVILVMGAGMVVMMRLRYPQPRVDHGTAVPAAAGSLPPGLGTAMTITRPRVGLPQMAATLCDLLARRVLTIEEAGGTMTIVVPPMDAAAPRLRPHEQVVMDALWLATKQGRLPLKDAQRRLMSVLSAFKAAAHQEIRDAGYVDAERRWAARSMTTSGVVTLLVGFAGLVASALWVSSMGPAAMLVPGAVIVLGVVFLIAGETFPALTTSGVSVGGQWAARAAFLKAEAAAHRAGQHAEEWLPVAVGLGLGPKFAKSGAVVSWLAGISNPSAALTAIIIAAGSPGNSAGISAGGMAGGGGFSGAR